MALLFPFRALRPTAEAASRVAAVPYDVVDTDEARALATDPLSFLHVSRAEIDLPPGTDPHADQVYARALANFTTLRQDVPLVQEAQPSLYLYRLRMGSHQQLGVAGLFSLPEYESGVIRKHERTRQDKEDDRTKHILALRAQTGPVFLTYPASPAIDELVKGAIGTATPLFDFTAADGIEHALWRVDGPAVWELMQAFAALPALYIADGHHRAASAARAWKQTGTDGFLAVAFPDDQVQVLPYNRAIKDLNGLTPSALLAQIRERFTVTDGAAAPPGRGHVSMFLAGRWYALALGPAPADLSPADRLDVSRLQDGVLGPILGIGDVRSDPRIDFVGGGRGTSELERLVSSGRAAVAFSLHPVGVDDLMTIADGGGIMPPKSTWFEPKLRDGLLTHII
jgi:uncharacterized protein (DUF1015 family)